MDAVDERVRGGRPHAVDEDERARDDRLPQPEVALPVRRVARDEDARAELGLEELVRDPAPHRVVHLADDRAARVDPEQPHRLDRSMMIESSRSPPGRWWSGVARGRAARKRRDDAVRGRGMSRGVSKTGGTGGVRARASRGALGARRGVSREGVWRRSRCVQSHSAWNTRANNNNRRERRDGGGTPRARVEDDDEGGSYVPDDESFRSRTKRGHGTTRDNRGRTSPTQSSTRVRVGCLSPIGRSVQTTSYVRDSNGVSCPSTRR